MKAKVASQYTRPSIGRDWRFLLAIILLAAALRLDFLVANNFVIDGDEAIVGLMAKHISEFKSWPVFYYGQEYLGSLESSIAAIVMFIVGPSIIALKAVPLLFSLWLIVLVFQLGLEFQSRSLARLAAIFIALPPQMLVIWSSMARGGFIELVCIGTLALLLSVRWLRASNPSPSMTGLIAFVLGLGWWVNNQIVYFILPISFFMLVAILRGGDNRLKLTPELAKHGSIATVAFLLGGLPYWWYNITHQFASFGIVKRAGLKQLISHIDGLFGTAIPVLLGARRQWHREEVFADAGVYVVSLFSFLLLILIVWRWRQIIALFQLKIDRKIPLEMLLVMVVCAFIIFSASSYGFLVESPRYLLPLYVPFAILSAGAICLLSSFSRFLGVCATLGVLYFNLSSCYLGGRALPGEPEVFKGQRVSKDHSELLAWLRDKNISLVRTNYWIGYRLAFESRESVKFTQFREPYSVRIPEYEKLVASSERDYLPLVLVPGQAKVVSRALRVEGVSYSEKELSNYVVLYDLKPSETHLLPLRNGLEASANENPAAAPLIIDGDSNTRWGSGRSQSPGMQVVVQLTKPRMLRGLRYDLGSWVHDEPADLNIDLELFDGKKVRIVDKFEYYAVRYYRDRANYLQFSFAPQPVRKVILTQNGSLKFFDWSIAELELLE